MNVTCFPRIFLLDMCAGTFFDQSNNRVKQRERERRKRMYTYIYPTSLFYLWKEEKMRERDTHTRSGRTRDAEKV